MVTIFLDGTSEYATWIAYLVPFMLAQYVQVAATAAQAAGSGYAASKQGGSFTGSKEGDVAVAVVGTAVPIIGVLAGIAKMFGFGAGKKLSHGEREAREASRALAGANQMIGAMQSASTFEELYAALLQWQTGYVGGTRSPAVDVGLWYAVPRGSSTTARDVNYLGLYGNHAGGQRILTPVEWWTEVIQEPGALYAHIQQGVSPGLLVGGNEAIRNAILDRVGVILDAERRRVLQPSVMSSATLGPAFANLNGQLKIEQQQQRPVRQAGLLGGMNWTPWMALALIGGVVAMAAARR